MPEVHEESGAVRIAGPEGVVAYLQCLSVEAAEFAHVG